MPSLPVSDFWQRSFCKYYKLTWVNENANNVSKTQKLLAKYNIPLILIVSISLYAVVLCIPLSINVSLSSDSCDIYPALYITYQVVYTWLSYPCAAQIFAVSLPTTLQSKLSRLLLPIPIFIGITVIYILYSPLIPALFVHRSRSYLRTLGPFIQHIYIAVVFCFIIVFQNIHKCCKQYVYQRNQSSVSHVHSQLMSSTISFCPTEDNISVIEQSITLAENNLLHMQAIAINNTYNDADSVSNKLCQCVFALLISAGIIAVYYWCQFLTWKWKTHNTSDISLWTELDNGSIFFYYPAFWMLVHVLKFVTVRFARYCDRNKYSEYSLELIISFFFTCFYYVFYRNLFLHMTSYKYFIFVKLFHILLEFVSYSVRMTAVYYKVTNRLQNKYKDECLCVLQPLMRILYDPSLYHIWCIRICIDYAMTLIVSVGSAVCYIVGVLWLRYGYNSCFYDLKNISEEQFTKTLVFTGISIGLELVIYMVIERVMRHRYQIDVMQHWKALITHRPAYIWYFIFMLQHVNTDVMIAKMHTNKV